VSGITTGTEQGIVRAWLYPICVHGKVSLGRTVVRMGGLRTIEPTNVEGTSLEHTAYSHAGDSKYSQTTKRSENRNEEHPPVMHQPMPPTRALQRLPPTCRKRNSTSSHLRRFRRSRRFGNGQKKRDPSVGSRERWSLTVERRVADCRSKEACKG
jgi:hypothetical protein